MQIKKKNFSGYSETFVLEMEISVWTCRVVIGELEDKEK